MRRIIGAIILGCAAVACGSTPPALTLYAEKELPGRNRGTYNSLDALIRAQLVLADATAACSVDVANGKDEKTSAACKCSAATSDTFEQVCAPWFDLGGPAPAPTPTTAPTTAPTTEPPVG